MSHKTQSHTQQLTHLKSLLTRSEIVHTDSASYVAESLPWALNRDESPSLVIRPTSLSTLSTVIAYLTTDSTLDFSVRSQGYGSASAQDVLISLSAFDEFSLDKESNTLILGAGQPWSEYYRKMEEVAPELTIVACRTPCIGIGGSVLSGGFSWLSGEFGCVSDPENLLDAQVVKVDGSVIWASEEPELLWALRGTQTGFGGIVNDP
jgi:FAD/FMN-containing dehydrogenase